jgi:hypothetical protein
MDLKEFLNKYASSLRNVRAFYIVEPLLEKGQTIKFGVAGMTSGNAYHRFQEYSVTYGERTKDNDCKGVLVHFVGITEYDRLVQPEKSQVYQLEKFLKQEYRSTTDPGRGTERVSKSYLQSILRTIRTKRFKDVQTQLRDTNRETTKRFQNDRRPFVNSTYGPATRAKKRVNRQ